MSSVILYNNALMLITDQTDLDKFCSQIKDAAFLTVDTEFLREKTYYPKLCLIQISDPEKNAAAIDPLVEDLDLTPVYELLFNPDILKIFHAGRQDLEIFYQLTEKVVTPIFDTQIAAMVCGYGDSVGYENLIREITKQSIDKSSQYTDWSRRPLSDKQIDYALGDVTHLVDAYKSLAQELETKGRLSWVYEEEEILNNPDTYYIDPQQAWQRIKIKTPKARTLQILKSLAAWRETRAQKKNIPKAWVMRDDTLSDMAAQAPTNVKQLSKIRNMSKDLAEGYIGKELLKHISEALESDPDTWPQPQKKRKLPPHVSACIDVLKMLLRLQSMEHGVATKLIANADDIEAIAMNETDKTKSLSGWRYDVFGKDALALKEGKLAITLRDNQIVKIELDGHG